MHHEPSICCQEFTPKNASVNPDNVQRFCLNCANYEVEGIPVCAKDHKLRRACRVFKRKTEIAATA